MFHYLVIFRLDRSSKLLYARRFLFYVRLLILQMPVVRANRNFIAHFHTGGVHPSQNYQTWEAGTEENERNRCSGCIKDGGVHTCHICVLSLISSHLFPPIMHRGEQKQYAYMTFLPRCPIQFEPLLASWRRSGLHVSLLCTYRGSVVLVFLFKKN